MNFYNSNSRIYDNCVFLTWGTTEDEYPSSDLFKASGKYFASQQDQSMTPKDAWDAYFPNVDTNFSNSAFVHLLKTTFQKPRDILTAIKILIEHHKRSGNQTPHFLLDELKNQKFTREFSDYLLGEVKNYASFYMTAIDFSHHLKFFQFLNGQNKFTYDEFTKAFDKFKSWAKGEEINCRDYIRDSESLLQFFYDVNIVGFKEVTADNSETYVHWSHREKTMNNFHPKVKKDGELVFNKGISKVLDIGKMLKTEVKASDRTSVPKKRKKYHKR
jgi:hypothetical protein